MSTVFAFSLSTRREDGFLLVYLSSLLKSCVLSLAWMSGQLFILALLLGSYVAFCPIYAEDAYFLHLSRTSL